MVPVGATGHNNKSTMKQSFRRFVLSEVNAPDSANKPNMHWMTSAYEKDEPELCPQLRDIPNVSAPAPISATPPP